MENPATIIEFWFGLDADDKLTADRQAKLWWSKDEALDADMRERFGPWLDQAAAHRLDGWAETAAGRLALILLTDQFPRNIHRGTPQSFAYDALARTWCKEGLREGVQAKLRPIERVFFYLPLEHSESLADQEQAVALFAELLEGVPEAQRETFRGYYDFAVRHREVISRFGRFPHRNQILGRESTPEELVFLQQKGSSF
jgi:uncharacterized protein (DUF924 family)